MLQPSLWARRGSWNSLPRQSVEHDGEANENEEGGMKRRKQTSRLTIVTRARKTLFLVGRPPVLTAVRISSGTKNSGLPPDPGKLPPAA